MGRSDAVNPLGKPAGIARGWAQIKLWDAANPLWAKADLKPSEYPPTVPGQILLRYANVRFSAVKEEIEPQAVSRRKVGMTDFHAASVCRARAGFIQSARFVEAHPKNPPSEVSVPGQDQWARSAHLRRAQLFRRLRQRRKLPNQRVTITARLVRLSLAVHGLSGDTKQGNTHYEDLQTGF